MTEVYYNLTLLDVPSPQSIKGCTEIEKGGSGWRVGAHVERYIVSGFLRIICGLVLQLTHSM